MDDVLLEKMVLELMPPEYRTNIESFFGALRKAPHAQSQQAMMQAGYLFTTADPDKVVFFINGFLTGMSFIYTWQKDPDVMTEAAREFLAIRDRKLGRNVVNFLDRKAEKKL